jgi:hypothetical protein
MMTHDEIRDRISDWIDGHLDPAETREVQGHLAECASCRTEAAVIREVIDEAGRLPVEIAPRRDLWQGIESRIRDPQVIPINRPRPSLSRHRGLLAAAAAVLVIASSAATAFLLRGAGGTELAGGSDAAVQRTGTDGTALVAFHPAEAEYLRAAGELEAVLEAGRGLLTPETVQVVEANLRIIDGAIAEARAALEADPNNRELVLLLSGAYGQKVELLQTAVHIQTRT